MLAYAPTMDRATQEFRFRSGAKNTYWIDQLVKYVKAQGLWSAFRLYHMQNRTNAGTGSVCYGLGGLTSNEMQFINGVGWTENGATFESASSQYGSIDFTGFGSITDLHIIFRSSPVNSSASDTGNAPNVFYGLTGDGVFTGGSTGATSGETLSSGLTGPATRRYGSSSFTWSAGEDVAFVSILTTSGGQMWKNKTSVTLDKTSNAGDVSPSASTWATDDIVTINAGRNTLSSTVTHTNQTAHALAFLTGAVTTTQRETITDLINAL